MKIILQFSPWIQHEITVGYKSKIHESAYLFTYSKWQLDKHYPKKKQEHSHPLKLRCWFRHPRLWRL